MRGGFFRSPPAIVAVAVFLVHALGNPHYGFYQDELYFIVCGFHPDWGYVDQPPLVPLLSGLSQLGGHSLFLLRLLPALFAAGAVYVTYLLAVEIGGSEYAGFLAAVTSALTPILAAFGTKVSTDMAGVLLWPLSALAIAKIINGGDKRFWLLAGAALGISAEAKYTAALYAAAIVAGLGLSPVRQVLRTPWFLAGAALGALIALPSVVWQAAHGFPILQVLANQQHYVVAFHPPLAALMQQFFITNPLLAPIWIAGVVYAFRVPRLRWIGWTYVLLMALLIALNGRDYYPGDVYPLVIAAGAVAIERMLHSGGARVAATSYVALVGALAMPFVLPVLPEPKLAEVVVATRQVVGTNFNTERQGGAALTDIFSGMHGWPELTAETAAVYRSLSPADRARAAVLASNFAEASALTFYGPAYALPSPISGHNNYWLWGPRGYDGSVVVEVGGTCGSMFRRQRVAVARFNDPWSSLTEQNVPISVCYGLREPLAQYWPKLKTYI